MTTEELLVPRWKCIADYPNSWFQIENIYTGKPMANPYTSTHYLIDNSPHGIGTVLPHKYPAIFKKLEWWEEREEKDLPEYVKYKNNTILKISRHPIHPEYYWDQSKLIHLGECMPATEQEYLSQ